MLAQWKFHFHCLRGNLAVLYEPFMQSHDQPRNPLVGGTAAEVDDELIRSVLLRDSGFRELVEQI
jgi:hypothetical protein